VSAVIKDRLHPPVGQRVGLIELRAAVPDELKARPQWLVWRFVWIKGKWTKVPHRSSLPDAEASTTDPSSWSTFDEAVEAYSDPSNKVEGIGFVFSEDDPYAGVDLDDCLKDGEVLEWAKPFLDDLLPSYSEVSPSGNGVKIFVKAMLAGTGTRKKGFGDDKDGAVEVYDRGRYFTVTGDAFDGPGRPVEDRADAINRLYAKLKPTKGAQLLPTPLLPPAPLDLTDSELVEKARKAKNGPKFSALYDRGDASAHANDQSSADFALVKLIAWWTGPDPARIDRIFKASALYREKWDDRRGDTTYGLTTIGNALEGMTEFYKPRKATPPNGKPPSTPEVAAASEPAPQLPQIEINPKQKVGLKKALSALATDPKIYRRGPCLVTVVRETRDSTRITPRSTLTNLAGSPRIVVLSDAIIGTRLTGVADFYKWRKNRAGEDVAVDVHPPDWLIKSIATLQHWPKIRRLMGVVECPFPRPDGSIVEKAGYDRETSTLYIPALDFPAIPQSPSRDDARSAWERLKRYVRQFPFATEDDRVVYLAGMLNVIARPAVQGPVMGVAVVGNRASTGKGLLVDAMTMPGIGRPAPTTTYPYEREEAAKVKVAIVLSGKPVVSFDNMDEGSMYGGGAMDSVLTAYTIDERILGVSKNTGDLEVRTTWFLNGNNISPAKDAYRRWMVCNLVTDLESPEDRDDIEDKNLRHTILDNRALIVRDALTILRAHALAKWPTGGWAAKGSFEEWDRVVRGAVWFATDRDCLATQKRAAQESPERRDKLALLEGWLELPGGNAGLTTTEAVRLAEDNPGRYPTLWEVMSRTGQSGKPLTSRQLGNRFRGLKNNRIGGLTLREAGERNGSTLWCVEAEGPRDRPQEDGISGCTGSEISPNAEIFPTNSDAITNTEDRKVPGKGPNQHPVEPEIPAKKGRTVPVDPDDPINAPNFRL
jgi:hypothetical protein